MRIQAVKMGFTRQQWRFRQGNEDLNEKGWVLGIKVRDVLGSVSEVR